MSTPPLICTLVPRLLPFASGSVGPAAFAKGRGGRGAPFAGAHSVPSHRFLRPRFAGTCLRRAPSLFPWPRGATPPAHLPPLLSSRARHSGYPPADYGAGNGRAGEEGRWARAHRTRLARRRRAPLSRGGGACLEGHVQECISVAVFVHVTELQSGAMNKISIPGLFMYMTLQTTSSLINFFVTSGIIAHQGQNSWQPYS